MKVFLFLLFGLPFCFAAAVAAIAAAATATVRRRRGRKNKNCRTPLFVLDDMRNRMREGEKGGGIYIPYNMEESCYGVIERKSSLELL